MGVTGAVFQPELIELMKAVLDDATATLPEAKRTRPIATQKTQPRARSPQTRCFCAGTFEREKNYDFRNWYFSYMARCPT